MTTKDDALAPIDKPEVFATSAQLDPAIQAAVALGREGVEVLKELDAIEARRDARAARRSFNAAMAELHGRLGSIPKTHDANFTTKAGGRVQYWYADQHDIASALRKAGAAQLGFSWYWSTKEAEGQKIVTCTLDHADGHSRESSWAAPIEQGNPMTSQSQKGKIATTFAERVTLKQVFGLTDCETDTDGQEPENGYEPRDMSGAKITPEEAEKIRARLAAINRTEYAFLEYVSKVWGCTEPIMHLEDIPATHLDDAWRVKGMR